MSTAEQSGGPTAPAGADRAASATGAAGRGLARLRAVPLAWWSWAGFALLCLGAILAFFLYPTYPEYDSMFALVWGREIADGTSPSFRGFRTPTEHPLWVAVAVALQPLGEAADRGLVAVTLAGGVALVAGTFRLARISFGWLVAAVAAVLLVSRLNFPLLALRGFLDIPYLALLMWAAALEAQRPRRGGPVWVLLILAGLLRPEAWALTLVYLVWIGWRGTWAQRVRWLAFTLLAPALWLLADKIVTDEWLFSFNHTSGTSSSLDRNASVGETPELAVDFLGTLLRPAVAIMGAAGIALALALRPRQVLVPGVLLLSGLAGFVAISLGGLAALERYLLISAVALTIFAAVAIAGWTLLRAGSTPLRPVWMALSPALVAVALVFTSGPLFGVQYTADTVTQRTNARAALREVLDAAAPQIERVRECGRISVPNHRMVPEVRWLLDLPEPAVLARSDRTQAAAGKTQQGAAIVIRDPELQFNPIYDIRPEPGDPEPTRHVWYRWDEAAENSTFAVLVRCPELGIGLPDGS